MMDGVRGEGAALAARAGQPTGTVGRLTVVGGRRVNAILLSGGGGHAGMEAMLEQSGLWSF